MKKRLLIITGILVFLIIILIFFFSYKGITGNPIFSSGTCIDYDNTIIQDNDGSYFESSYVKYFFWGKPKIYEDKCYGNRLSEKYCDRKRVRTKIIDCLNGCEDGACVITKTGCNESLIIFQEIEENEFFFPLDDEGNRGLNTGNILNKLYKTYEDKYDFLVFVPYTKIRSSNNQVVNRNISGIGEDNEDHSPYLFGLNLKSITEYSLFDSYNTYKKTDTPLNFQLEIMQVLIHEIGHYWCCDIKGFYLNKEKKLPTHWPNNVDLFYGNLGYVDPLGYNNWILENNTEQCSNINNINNLRFSNLTLYLMGLITSKEVAPIKIYDFEKKEDNFWYNRYGPGCYEEHNFTDTREISIQEIINLNGERIPSSLNSQNNFNTAFIIIFPFDKEIDKDFINYINLYKEALPETWANATNYKSKITFCN